MSVKVFHVVMVIFMGGLTSSLPLESVDRQRRDVSGACKMCPAGEYLESCHVCAPCGNGSYTSSKNNEHTCHSCFKDCREEMHMIVKKHCSKTADVVCDCMKGYECKKRDIVTDQCSRCELTQTTPKSTWNPSTTLSPLTSNPISNSHAGRRDVWIFVTVLLSILLSITIIPYFCRQRKKECLKQLVKRCSQGNQKLQEDNDTTSPQAHQSIQEHHAQRTHPYTQTSTNCILDCPAHQLTSTEQPLPTAGNLGSLHIHEASTVYVSFVNQFTEGGGERDEVDLRPQAVNEMETCCPPSPMLPLSKEEWNRDSGFISFPSQEQGKECHVSKEEGL